MSRVSDDALHQMLLVDYEDVPYEEMQATQASIRIIQALTRRRQRRLRQLMFLVTVGVGSPLLLVAAGFIRFLIALLVHLGLALRDGAMSALHANASAGPISGILAAVLVAVAVTLTITGTKMAGAHG
ncbi:MAG: hypothetical protein OWT28_12715 [Firmicutes bacterium]|nr:hypothetical protein [Bacillota bacterium]